MATLPAIIGLPPLFDDNIGNINEKMIDSMPIATIIPKLPEFKLGMSTMSLSGGGVSSKYISILNAHGYSLFNESEGLKVAFLADSFPTDSFSNSYSEGFLQNFANGLSRKASDITQTLGGDSAIDTMGLLSKGIGKEMSGMGGIGSVMGGVMGGIAGGLKSFDNKLKSKHATGSKMLDSALSNMNTVASGARVDFPQIWTDSQFSPSYTMTIRLYNPDPSSHESTDKYITGPVAALLLLGIPISADGNSSTYNYPFLHDLNAKGIYHLNPCYISNIAVIKGGDQQQIAYNQTMGIVDVRLDFGSLYSSILASTDPSVLDRPTLGSYLDSFGDRKGIKYVNPINGNNDNNGNQNNNQNDDPGVDIPDPTGTDVIPRDPDPNVTKQMFKANVLLAGSLQQAIKDGLAIPEDMAKELFKDGVVNLQDLLASFPNVNLDDLKDFMGNIPKDFITDLTDDQLKHIGGNMLQNIMDTANHLDVPTGDMFGLNQNLLGNISAIAEINKLSAGTIINTQQSFFASMKDSIANGASVAFNGAKSLFSSAGSMVNKLGLGANSVLKMGGSLFSNMTSSIGGALTGNQLVKSAGSMLGVVGDRMTPAASSSLLSRLQSSAGDFSLKSGIDLVNSVKAVSTGDIFASLDLVDEVKRLSSTLGIEDNTMLASSIGIFDNVKKTVSDTGLLDNNVIEGGIELFRENYDYYGDYNLSLRSSSSLFNSMANISDHLNIPGADVISTGLNTFNNMEDIQNTLKWKQDDVLGASSSVLGSVQRISSDLGITEDQTVRAGKNMLDNMSNITDDVETMMTIIKS